MLCPSPGSVARRPLGMPTPAWIRAVCQRGPGAAVPLIARSCPVPGEDVS